MCGILALVRARDGSAFTAPLLAATQAVRHRGPDDEGYLLWGAGSSVMPFAGPETAGSTRDHFRLPPLPERAEWRVGLGHRRLSIIDLSPAGHQPMVHRPTRMAVVYNGEIYNHAELRVELEARGHAFESHCDTEVLLAAWAEWGPSCLERFNGMFSFVLLDPRGSGTVHAVRDRFGVKPLYWSEVAGTLAFASEIKSIRSLPGFRARLDEATVRDYLATGLMDHSAHTFDEGITQLRGGERAEVRLGEVAPVVRTERWYTLRPLPFKGSMADAAARLTELLADSVRLRLRADVPVGSCLSGGLDSSAIVCLTDRLLTRDGGPHARMTVTARFEEARFDEWRFAEQVISAAEVSSVQVWPSSDRLEAELDRQLWYMDEPFGSTSQFSQWCVFGAAAEAGLTVMLDGQGSDEQLAGYSGSDGPLYAGLLRRGALMDLGREVRSFRQRHGLLPKAQLLGAAAQTFPLLGRALPHAAPSAPEWMRGDWPSHRAPDCLRSLGEALEQQTLSTSLPVLLRYEDRNSMAHSIEARVPFLDHRLAEFVRGVPDEFKLRNGVTKLVFREAMRGVLPEPVRDRRDKMGFVTPEETWLKRSASEWFRRGVIEGIEEAAEFIDPDRAIAMVDNVVAGRAPFTFAPWRILCFGRWRSAAVSVADVPVAPESVTCGR